MKAPPDVCPCCERPVKSWNDIDSIYGVCHPCAFEQSLEHYPCDHGAAEEAARTTSPRKT